MAKQTNGNFNGDLADGRNALIFSYLIGASGGGLIIRSLSIYNK